MFGVSDYIVFFGLLIVSALIGFYYAFCGKKQITKQEYLLGGKSMKVVPVAMSLIVSNCSAITLLSVPADVYKFGVNYWWSVFSVCLASVAAVFIYMPVFLKADIINTYKYLEIRFNKNIKILTSCIFVLSMILYNSIILYVPSLGVSQATGFSVHLIIFFLCAICMFYTTTGGLKGVIWADTLQSVSLSISLLIVLYLGFINSGGLADGWRKLSETGRLDLFNFNVDLTDRDSFWAHTVGTVTLWVHNFSVSQASMQRFLAVRSIQHAKRSIVIYSIGFVIIKTVCIAIGLLIFLKYANCDPLTTKQLSRADQLVPYFLEDVAGNIPCLSGLFIAGVVSAGLSTLSTTLNTLACVIYEDFVSVFIPDNSTSIQSGTILKLIVVVAGVLCIALVYLVELLGDALPILITFTGATAGPLLGLFTLGMLFPSANSIGAFCGGIGGFLLNFWILIGHEWYKSHGFIQYTPRPLSVDGCDFIVNITKIDDHMVYKEQPFFLYRIAFWYITTFGAVAVVVIGLIASWITKKDDHYVNPDLISPPFHFLLPKEKKGELEPDI